MKKLISLTLCLLILLGVMAPFSALAQDARHKTVRVGWYESTYCFRDQYGRRGGIAYEYQQRIAAHTGWTYEYVEESWPILLQMLIDGEIDLLSDVSYMEERAKLMLYPSLAMGSESYYIYIDADNTKINPENLQSFNGCRIGVNKGSYQQKLLQDWAEKNKLTPEIEELTDDEAYSMIMLSRGNIDALVSMNSFGAQERVVPVCKIGSSDYYFAINKDRPDLLAELNRALIAVQDEDPYFNQRMFDEYVQLTRTNAFLLPSQEEWLSAHGAVRVGYWDNYLPFCALDKVTGQITGALKDYLAHAAHILKNADILFEPVPFASTDAAIAAMKAGEVDCVFPVNLSTYDGETMGLLTVNPIMQTEMSLLTRADDLAENALKRNITVAVDRGNVNIETFIKDDVPGWTIRNFDTPEDCFRAVSAREADGLLACNYRAFEYEPLRKRYRLAALPTGETMGLSFAVTQENPELYSILNKIANLSSGEDMEYALVTYMYSNQKVSLWEFLEDNWIAVVLFITALFSVLLFLLRKKLNAERKVNEQEKQIEAALRRELAQKEQLRSVIEMAYRDPLTGVKSKHAYVEAEERMNRRIANGEVSAFGVVLFDLNGLKEINDSQGHEVGDRYIREACRIICARFKHSPVFRLGGDEFVTILEGEDFGNREQLLGEFDSLMDTNLREGRITVAFGCACFDPAQDQSMHTVLERADANMYRRKKQMKEAERE